MTTYKTGQHGKYFWIEFPQNYFSLTDLVNKCSVILMNKYLAVVFFDSGPLGLTSKELNLGWYEKNEIAYSPKLTDALITNLPADQFDQWCLFNEPTELSSMTDFVNIGGFKLSSRRHELATADPTWDLIGLERQIEFHEQRTEQFWAELSKINPVTFISNGDNFIFVTEELNDIEILKKNSR